MKCHSCKTLSERQSRSCKFRERGSCEGKGTPGTRVPKDSYSGKFRFASVACFGRRFYTSRRLVMSPSLMMDPERSPARAAVMTNLHPTRVLLPSPDVLMDFCDILSSPASRPITECRFRSQLSPCAHGCKLR